MRRKLSLLALLVLAVTGCASIWLAGGVLTASAPQTIGAIPAGLSGRLVEFHSESGSTIHGWLIPGKASAGAIVLMHGVRSNRLSMVGRARFLSQAGYSVLLFDFQAHGESDGTHITFGSLERKDAQAAIQFLRDNAPGEKIGVVGVSMGGAAAILATPPLSVDAMAIEMVYPTINEAVNDRLTLRLGRWARILTPLLIIQLRPRLGVDPDELRPIDHVNQLTFPKLFIAGADDHHTTIEESRHLYETACAPKELWIVPGAAHVDLHEASKIEYELRLLNFFKSNLK
jgi:pimeloyl-ACP methyl ester carboxylesterase